MDLSIAFVITAGVSIYILVFAVVIISAIRTRATRQYALFFAAAMAVTPILLVFAFILFALLLWGIP
jgi:hypothetical protein